MPLENIHLEWIVSQILYIIGLSFDFMKCRKIIMTNY